MAYVKAFDDAEFERRRSAVGNRMEDAGFELLVCQDPANMNWLTGFDGWSFYTPQAVLVHRDEEIPIWFGRAQDARSATITTNLPPDNVVALARRAASATPSASVSRPTGASGPRACVPAIPRCWSPACAFTSSRGCGSTISARRSRSRSSSPKAAVSGCARWSEISLSWGEPRRSPRFPRMERQPGNLRRWGSNGGVGEVWSSSGLLSVRGRTFRARGHRPNCRCGTCLTSSGI